MGTWPSSVNRSSLWKNVNTFHRKCCRQLNATADGKYCDPFSNSRSTLFRYDCRLSYWHVLRNRLQWFLNKFWRMLLQNVKKKHFSKFKAFSSANTLRRILKLNLVTFSSKYIVLKKTSVNFIWFGIKLTIVLWNVHANTRRTIDSCILTST